ncbi:MAG: S8 family serine peptidase [Woeseiaceae bacterium]
MSAPSMKLSILRALAALGLAVTAGIVHAYPGDAPFAVEDGRAGLEFTLITGDKVVATVGANGELSGVRLLGDDGEEVVTSIFRRAGNTYVVPDNAQALVDARAIDMELFNLSKLHASGYDDASTDKLPVIVEYLEIIDSAAYGIEKARAAEFWDSVTANVSIEGVWLDAVLFAHDATSKSKSITLTPTVPLTGAWGEYASAYTGDGVTVAVLDGGVDAGHADLAGRVTLARDFVWSRNGTGDLRGHGTHVASTVAGTGAESDGKWAGMAPEADLIIAKVMNNAGAGSSWYIMQGMQWAVESGAEIVNMSLGMSGTYCGGPIVDMVEALSDEALFVVSAGNSFTRESVGLPGCAPSALTVGAVDRSNQTANFSSRGPSPDGHTAKPDIASQGVDVVAAASGGSGATAYRVYSGTSMAAPHVAGGAALVLEARPELSPRQLKAVLTSSVQLSDAHVLEQGAGPMDVNRAIMQAITASPNQELGYFDYQQGTMTESAVVLENGSDQDVALKVRMDLIGEDGKSQLPATLAGLGVKSVLVPAHGSVEVPVWIDPSVAINDGAYGTITGRIVGTSTGTDDTQVSVPLSFWIGPPMVNVTVSATDRFGMPASYPSRVFLLNAEDEWASYSTFGYDGETTLTVPAGEYSIVANIMTYDNPVSGGLVESAAMMAKLGQRIVGDTQLHFDALDAEKLEFKADRPIDTLGFSFGFTYELNDGGEAKVAGIELAPDYVNEMYGWSQGYDDHFRSFVTTRAVAPKTVVTTGGGHEIEYSYASLALAFHGEGSAEVVAVGDGNYGTDWDSFGLEGKVALLSNPYYVSSTMVGEIAERGAVGVIAYRPNTNGRFRPTVSGTPKIPVIVTTAEHGEVLQAELDQGVATVSWAGTAPERSPYAYSLNHLVDGRIDMGLARVHDHKLASIDASYYTQVEEGPGWTDVFAAMPGTGEFYSTGSPQLIMRPIERTEYFTASDRTAWTNVVMPSARLASGGGYFDGPRIFAEGQREATSWFRAPRGTTLLTSGASIAWRDTNVLSWNISGLGDADGHDGSAGYSGSAFYTITVNGVPTYLDTGMLQVPDQLTDIRLETRYYARGAGDRSPTGEVLGTEIATVRQFQTDATAQGVQPVLVPMIDIPVNRENTYPAGMPAYVSLSGMVDGRGVAELSSVQVQYAFGIECNLTGFTYCDTFAKFDPSNWVDAEVFLVDGEWMATIPNEAESGQYVHLRVLMTDASGNSSVDQSMMRAYLLD